MSIKKHEEMLEIFFSDFFMSMEKNYLKTFFHISSCQSEKNSLKHAIPMKWINQTRQMRRDWFRRLNKYDWLAIS